MSDSKTFIDFGVFFKGLFLVTESVLSPIGIDVVPLILVTFMSNFLGKDRHGTEFWYVWYNTKSLLQEKLIFGTNDMSRTFHR